MISYSFKIILAGSGGCGKTTLMNKFVTGVFDERTRMTIGAGFSVKKINIDDKYDVTLQIWDFGGEERFRVMLSSYCLGSKGCLLFFDLKRPYTFHELNEWLSIIRNSTQGEIPIILLGTKHDLLTSEHDLDPIKREINEFVEKNSLKEYLSVSSKTELNVVESFESLCRYMLKKK